MHREFRRHTVWLCLLLIVTACGINTGIDPKNFNQNRTPLADDVLDGIILPQQIGGYSLRPSQGWNGRYSGSRQYAGIYEDLSGREMLLSVALNTDVMVRKNAVTTVNDCNDPSAQVTSFLDGATQYAYTACKDAGTFTWINGRWIIAASTYHKVTTGDLLKFVNQYPY